MKMDVNVLLFPGFEPLDVFGPVEVLLHLKGVNLRYFSLNGGKVGTYKTLFIETLPLEEIHAAGVFLLPGGPGTRKLVNEPLFLDKIKEIAEQATSVLTVCTGSALLAKTGLLDHKQATSNKRAFKWATAQNKQVLWIKKARWVKDGNLYSSSGVSAGIDMVLAFVADICSTAQADKIATQIEYHRNKTANDDPFSELYD
ncbi:ThiJ PfpI domain-containing protein [Liquorilactobacillus satsumensis DSM 16230 = JCM 12392]|uniref:ThiJ PfpI domain-containing protein n=2 Tax=Liquorilactobacillus satsumensis TaxID=259059 RepID=A0A0R1V082_9LACO|nr:ThiJ PfpI domain-containing protein [Liquorilactobacillus satsumensis DSM 16230 = JCM 12392]